MPVQLGYKACVEIRWSGLICHLAWLAVFPDFDDLAVAEDEL